jgi:hypothetical protein
MFSASTSKADRRLESSTDRTEDLLLGQASIPRTRIQKLMRVALLLPKRQSSAIVTTAQQARETRYIKRCHVGIGGRRSKTEEGRKSNLNRTSKRRETNLPPETKKRGKKSKQESFKKNYS